jgi:ubiquinone/menaquinone biosynthesis C-methylase UbiE
VSQQTPQPSPEHFFETVNAYQRTAAIKAAVELDLFTAVAEGARTAPELAARLGAAERGVRILCDYLVVNGFLTKDGKSYGLTQDSAVFLDRRSPAYIGGATEFLLSETLTSAFENLTAAVRKGGTAANDEGGTVSPENPVWVKFARAMAPMIRMPAQAMAEMVAEPGHPQKVLDIAAGHGLFGVTIAQANPQAQVVALDWPAVLEVAKENARAAGVEDRFSTLEGSAFDLDYGTGYDVVLMTNFLHHFDPETCETLLRKVRAALADGGRVLTLEFVPNEDRVSPPIPATFSMTMLGSTPAGDAYTFDELEGMFRNAGFSRSELHALPASPQSLILSYK